MYLSTIYKNKHRIYQEYKRFDKDDNKEIYTFLAQTDLNVLLEMNGPKNSIYENTKYEIHIQLSSEYPFKPPRVKVLTPIIHPNIYKGRVCVDILKYNWSPAFTIHSVMLIIYNLLVYPDISDTTQSLSSKHAVYKKSSMRHFEVWGGRRDFMMYLAGMGLLEKKEPTKTDKENFSKVLETNLISKNALDVISRRDYVVNILSYL